MLTVDESVVDDVDQHEERGQVENLIDQSEQARAIPTNIYVSAV